jgi:hypothetical protein
LILEKHKNNRFIFCGGTPAPVCISKKGGRGRLPAKCLSEDEDKLPKGREAAAHGCQEGQLEGPKGEGEMARIEEETDKWK